MLDTDSVNSVLRGQGQVADRMVRHPPNELCISAITLAELRKHADNVRSRKFHRLIDQFVARVEVMAFDERCARLYGEIASEIEKREDLRKLEAMVAAHALAIGATLVTNNVKHFARIRGLRVENWL